MLAAQVSCANEYAKEKNMKFSTKCHGVLRGITYLTICLYSSIPKVVLYREVFLKVSFKGWLQVSVLLELVIRVNISW